MPRQLFPGFFSSSDLSLAVWVGPYEMLAPHQSITTDLLTFYFIALLIANQAERERRRRPYTAETCAGLLFFLPYLESSKGKI